MGSSRQVAVMVMCVLLLTANTAAAWEWSDLTKAGMFVTDKERGGCDTSRRGVEVPSTADEWQGLADEFEQRWQFPNCIGAIDGKHIQIRSPGGGSDYFNYQSYNSIILLALVDAKYCITWFSVGCNGRAGDAAVFSQSSLAECMEDEENRLGIPAPKPLPGRVDPVPYVIVGDDAFGLKPYMMKPYTFKSTLTSSGAATDPAEMERRKQRLFDYRLSRARRLSENVFGILVAKFGVFQRAMRLSPDNATTVSLACVALHNFLMRRKDNLFAHPRLTDREHPVTRENIGGEWRQNQHTALRAIDRQADVVWKVGAPIAGGVAAVVAAPVVLTAAGFGAGGVAAGTLAAKVMSTAWSSGVGIGAVAGLQSAGAAGLTLAQGVFLGSAGAAVTSYVTSDGKKESCDEKGN
ncbi:hypothetical protein ACOMHN_060676 [Nucella lapillus]